MTEQPDEALDASDHEAKLPPPRIYYYALGLTLATLVYFSLTHSELSPLNRGLGLGMLALCALPTLQWCRSRTKGIPVFAILGLANLAVYALPLLRNKEQVLQYQEETLTRSAFAVVLLQASMLATYHLTRARPGQGRFFTESLISGKARRYLLGALVLSTAYSYIAALNDFIPYQINGLVRAVCLGLGMLSVFYFSSQLGEGRISRGERLLLVACILLQMVFNCATLMIVSSISLLVLAVIGYVSGGRRLPVIVLSVSIPLFALLHNGKQTLREKYWDQATGARQTPTLTQLPSFYVEWFHAGLVPGSRADGQEPAGMTAGLLDRSSMIQMLCLVTDCTPYRQPYLGGETYADIPGQFVPRILWPDKPSAHVSTTRLSIYYGLQDEDATNWTTIGFGLIAEAYANFGYIGILGLGCFLGFLYKQAAVRIGGSPLLSGAGMIMVMLSAWSFQTEFTMSIWIVSLVQACLASILFPMAIRKLLG
jgi:hypothetical protein